MEASFTVVFMAAIPPGNEKVIARDCPNYNNPGPDGIISKHDLIAVTVSSFGQRAWDRIEWLRTGDIDIATRNLHRMFWGFKLLPMTDKEQLFFDDYMENYTFIRS